MIETRLRQVGDDEVIDEPPQIAPPNGSDTVAQALTNAGLAMMVTGLKALSQRALVGLSACFTLLSVASAFWLWLTFLPEPNPSKLVGLALYGVFLLVIEWIRRR